MYKIELPQNMLRDLYLLREFGGQKSIVGQVRKSVANHIREFSRKMGCNPQELQEIVEKHERSKKKELVE